MNVQHSPQKVAADLQQHLDKIDRATGQELSPPGYGEDHRKFIDACVENIVTDICKRLQDLHAQLKAIEDQVLASAERARGALREHVAVAVRLNDEIRAMSMVITDLAEQTRATKP